MDVKKRYYVCVSPNSTELCEKFNNAGLLSVAGLEYETDKLNSKNELKQIIKGNRDVADDVVIKESAIDLLVNELMINGFILDEIKDDGFIAIGASNEIRQLTVIDRLFDFKLSHILEMLQEEEQENIFIVPYLNGQVVNGVVISDWHKLRYIYLNRVSNQKEWAQATEKQLKKMLVLYSQDLGNRNSNIVRAKQDCLQLFKEGLFDDLIADNVINKQVLLSKQNIIYIDDLQRKLALPNSYQVTQPDIRYIQPTLEVLHDDDVFNQCFDRVDISSIRESDNYICFVGEYSNSFVIDDQKISSKYLFLIDKTDSNSKYFYTYKSEAHQQNMIGYHCGNEFEASLYYDAICDFCGSTVERIHRDSVTFDCTECGQTN